MDYQIISSENKAKRIGQFKTKNKFIEFVGTHGNINFFTNEAIVEGKYLSGSLAQDVKFKLTICDQGTVDFEEVGGNTTTLEERGRLLDLISEKTISPSRVKNHFIVSDIPFISTKQIKGLDIKVYLAVEYQTPIAKLASIIDEWEEVTLSEEQDNKINQLLSMFDDETGIDALVSQNETQEKPESQFESQSDKSESQKILEESFKNMKREKIEELEKEIQHQRRELARFESEKINVEKKLAQIKDDIKLLESRLWDLSPKAEPNGYIFHVSEELNQKINLPKDIEAIIREKVSKVKGINIEAFMGLFKGGEYQIRLAKVESDRIFGDHLVEVTDYENLPEGIKEKLNFLHIHGGKLIHHGDMKWHDLIQRMLKLGFEQSAEFDKMCSSNSFGS
jgi:flagellar biosynthesis GTPase FlhF